MKKEPNVKALLPILVFLIIYLPDGRIVSRSLTVSSDRNSGFHFAGLRYHEGQNTQGEHEILSVIWGPFMR